LDEKIQKKQTLLPAPNFVVDRQLFAPGEHLKKRGVTFPPFFIMDFRKTGDRKFLTITILK